MGETPRWGSGRACRTLAVAFALTLALTYPSQVSAQGGAEAHLEPGFPLYNYKLPGTYMTGEASDNILLGNVDADPEAEIFVPSAAAGPLFAWNGDGSPLSGWPVLDLAGFPHAGLGDLAPDSPALDVFIGTSWAGKLGPRAGAFTSEGRALPGWPRTMPDWTTSTPAMDDVDGDGLDEVFVQDGIGDLTAYRNDGSLLPGWPIDDYNIHDFSTPAIADIDASGDLEIVAADDGDVYAWNVDGSYQPGFPVKVQEKGFVHTPTAIGDVDGDGALEIVAVNREQQSPAHARVAIVSASGSVERVLEVPATAAYGVAPALANLAGDGAPEIVLHVGRQVYAWHGDGSLVDGWPATVGSQLTGVSPLVADVDGDPGQEVIVVASEGSSSAGLWVLSAAGDIEPGFPWHLPVRSPNMPAVGDVDGDGRNEIVVAGDETEYIGYNLGVLAYDLGGGPHGKVEWGQFGGGPRHQSRYEGLRAPRPLPEPAGSPSTEPAGLVRDIAAGTAASEPREPEPFLDKLFFQAEDAEAGAELWASDGTAVTTGRVRDIRPGSASSRPRELTPVGSTLFFVADDGSSGAELWKTDGTLSGTQLVRDIWPGSRGSAPRHLTSFDGELYFSAWDGEHGYELWRSDGTAAGTQMVADMLVGSGATAHGAGAGSDPTHILPFEGELHFSAFTAEPWDGDYGLWRLPADGGAPEPVEQMGLFLLNPWMPTELVGSGGRLWLSIIGKNVSVIEDDGRRSVFSSELDAAITRLLPFGDGIVFGGQRPGVSHRVWRVADPAASASALGPPPAVAGRAVAPGYMAILGGRVFVSGGEQSHGTELWTSDGAGSMSLLADIQVGPGSSAPSLLTRIGERLLFAADDGQTGREPWVTDGSAAGTVMLQDIAPGARGSNVEWFAQAGGHIFFGADDGAHGQELWALPVERSEQQPEDPDTPDEQPDTPDERPDQPDPPSDEPHSQPGQPENRRSSDRFTPSQTPIDRSAPVVHRVRLRPRKLRLIVDMSEAGSIRIEIRRRRNGRPGKRVRKLRFDASPGVNRLRLGKALPRGRYVLRLVVFDTAGNHGRAVRRTFVAAG
jgi:ELWxxDGT repeat protein